jgi:hypothetical protein
LKLSLINPSTKPQGLINVGENDNWKKLTEHRLRNALLI